MKQTVHILMTVRNSQLWHAALLVFRTLRMGFPDAAVRVWGNDLDADAARMVGQAAQKLDGQFQNIKPTTHGKWIETLVFNSNEPFWICDTDMVFFRVVEPPRRQEEVLFSGRYEPEFMEEWTGMRHVARLHPSLMWFNPAALRPVLRAWPASAGSSGAASPFFGTVKRNFFEWEFVPSRKGEARREKAEVLFYDTCAGLYHAIGGTAFTEKQDAAFEHLHCGTYSDLIGQHLSLAGSMEENHRAIFMEPAMARGLWAQQARYYASRKPRNK
jgi:hypothetical protein